MRKDFAIIENWISSQSHVVDLGCGDGELFHLLQIKKQVHGYGVEKDLKMIRCCLERKVPVLQQDIEYWVKTVSNQSIDYVILSNSIQTLKRPDFTMQEILRIGKQAIISFPNMAYWHCRWYLAINGKMPMSNTLPEQWYESKNIHLCTITDFENLCQDLKVTIRAKKYIQGIPLLKQVHPNLFCESVIYLLDGNQDYEGDFCCPILTS
ncbi:MAG: methionine biosynthesis protein MetW [Methylacidiphilales bacterium]|nr:methionine biosynthesis protein MetW [Candidatus Methylacidiphilales bacterium]